MEIHAASVELPTSTTLSRRAGRVSAPPPLVPQKMQGACIRPFLPWLHLERCAKRSRIVSQASVRDNFRRELGHGELPLNFDTGLRYTKYQQLRWCH